MTNRRISWLALSAFVLIGGGWAVVQSGISADSSTDDAPDARLLMVATSPLVQEEAFRQRRHFTGQVVAARSSDLSFQLAGQVDVLYFDEGQTVQQGETLAALDTRRLRAARKRLEAELQQAQSVLQELSNGSREEDIRAAKAEVQQLEAESALYQKRLERTKKLADRGTSTQDELDLARTNWESSAARLAAAQARQDEIVAGPRAEKIEAQRATVAALEASIGELDVQLDDSVLTAPYSGTLAVRLADPGAIVSAGQPVFRIVEDRSLEFHVGLPSAAVSGLDRQSSFEVRIGGRSLAAHVARTLPVLNTATRTQTVILEFASCDGVVPGQSGELLLDERISQAGYWVPNTALQEGIQGLWTCYVAVPGESETTLCLVESRDVELLYVEEDRSYVRGTLAEGERIVTSGLHRLVTNQTVKLAE